MPSGRIASLALGAALALAALALPGRPAEAQSYPLTCRGGGNLSIVGDGAGGISIAFLPSSGAVPLGLQPGQCTWSDRALVAGEPTVICDTVANAVGYVQLLLQDTQYVIFQVYNEAGTCMRVTRVGP